MIHLRHINKSYGRHHVLHDLSLQLRKHEIHMLMGSNGAGKTTLARIIAGLETPDSGIIEGTQNLRTMVMQQDFVIWPELTVTQNMSIAEDQKQALHWLEKSGLIGVAKTKAGQLSHGQKQRLSIARAMAFQPQLLVIDEAFAYLDPARTAEAQTWILQALADDTNPLISVLWISQSSQEALSTANHISILEHGRIIDSGSPEKIYLTPTTLTAARLTGALSLFTHAEWQSTHDLITLPEGTGEPTPAETLAFRPEWGDLTPCTSGEMGFTILRSHFHPHGYISHLSHAGAPSLKVLTPEQPDPALTYRLILTHPPCILPKI
jgi:ABC-type multidrug transport system ATPase subunit